jgi:2'-5' RNA ligase
VSGITKNHIKGQYAGADGKLAEGLFFIAVLPPLAIQEQITLFKQEVRDKYGSKHALNSPPHITLHMPFKWPLRKQDRLISTIQEMAIAGRMLTITLKDFNVFRPRVIFIDVLENQPLRELQKNVVGLARLRLGLDNGDYKQRGFRPHLTIAFRDLKKPMFLKAWEYFRTQRFEATFQIEKITLLRYLDGRWNLFSEFPLGIKE